MAFPNVDATSGGKDTSAATSRNVVLPTGGATGNLYFVVLGSFSNPVVSTPTAGWTVVSQAGNSPVIALIAGIQGTAATPLAVATNASVETAYIAYTISAWSGNIGDINLAFTVGQSSANAQPPPLTNATSQDYLWLAAASTANGSVPITAGPSGWSNFLAQNNAAVSGGDIGTAQLQQTGTSVSPGSFTNTNRGWTSCTMSISPAAASAGSPRPVTVIRGACNRSYTW